MSAPAKPANPLATRAQLEAERTVLRLERHDAIEAIRGTLRRRLLEDPAAATVDGRASLDRVLDQWIRHYLLIQVGMDQPAPAFLWIADNTPRHWFGHSFPGDIVAGDNPDNTNRGVFLDGDSRYELSGCYGMPGSAQFSLNLEVAAPVSVALGQHLATLTNRTIALRPEGGFRVTIDRDPAGGRPNHMQAQPGLLNLTARDSRSDWRQQATTLSLRCVSGPGLRPAPDEAARLARIVDGLPGFVEYWSRFKDGFLGFPEPNRMVMPKRRDSEGGWGHLGGGRFRIAPDEALIVTATDAGADYTGFQLTDPWTLRPETVLRTSSLNRTQAQASPDGTTTYVVAMRDPGIANWIDTAGLREGWLQLRWQNIPEGATPAVEPWRLVGLDEIARVLPPDVPRADLAYRQRQIGDRVAGMGQRTIEAPPP